MTEFVLVQKDRLNPFVLIEKSSFVQPTLPSVSTKSNIVCSDELHFHAQDIYPELDFSALFDPERRWQVGNGVDPNKFYWGQFYSSNKLKLLSVKFNFEGPIWADTDYQYIASELKMQGSNDGISWEPIGEASSIPITPTPFDVVLNQNQNYWNYFRILVKPRNTVAAILWGIEIEAQQCKQFVSVE